MSKHFLVKIGNSHHGSLVPGMLIVVEEGDISENGHFLNPIDGGYSSGQIICPLTEIQEDFIVNGAEPILHLEDESPYDQGHKAEYEDPCPYEDGTWEAEQWYYGLNDMHLLY